MLLPSRTSRRPARAVILLALALALVGCQEEVAEDDPIVVGVGSTPEQRVLAALTVAALEDFGLEAALETELGSTVGLRRVALRGEIDLFWDYTGAAWGLGLRQQNPPAEPAESYERVREEDLDQGLVWLAPSSANATLAIFVRAADLDGRGMEWLSGELSGGSAPLCVDADFQTRAGGLAELATVYPMDLGRVDVVPASEDQAVAWTASGRCFAGLATATSGEAAAQDLVPVTDELGAFPAFIAAPVVRDDVLRGEPDIADALEQVTTRLDTAALARLNAEAGIAADAGELQALAERFLAETTAEAAG
ncbi:MAG: hypothetical protein H0V93_02570 [Euzebyales bacterium]|jgi:osmoprotectant transport system substrate-binding protein|nr:hypothetical protein [Euzebyales bacterium]